MASDIAVNTGWGIKINHAKGVLGTHRIWISSASIFLHVPIDLENEPKLNFELKTWLSFAYQKPNEVVLLKTPQPPPNSSEKVVVNC